jgi:hypothetical protein
MDEILKFLTQFNQSAGIVTGLMSPTGAIGALLAVVQRIRERRAAGQDVSQDLDQLIILYDKAVEELKAANADYWAIPVKEQDNGEGSSEG